MSQKNTVDSEAVVLSVPLRRSLRLRNLSSTAVPHNENSPPDSRTPTQAVKTRQPSEIEELDTSKEKEVTPSTEKEKLSETLLGQSKLDILPQFKESEEVRLKEVKFVCLKCGTSNTIQKLDEVLETKNASTRQSEIKNQQQENKSTEQSNTESFHTSEKNLIGRLKEKLFDAMYHSNHQIQEKVMNKTKKKISAISTKVCEIENVAPQETATDSVHRNHFVPVDITSSHNNNIVTMNRNSKETSSSKLIESLEQIGNYKNCTKPNILSRENLEEKADNTENMREKNSSDLFVEKTSAASYDPSSQLKSCNTPNRRNTEEIVGTDISTKVRDDESHVMDSSNTDEKIEENLHTMVDLEKKEKCKSEEGLEVDENSSLDSKIDELLANANISGSESDTEQNSFLNMMAEEGEEDTLSEGSNDIIEVGEEINTTESDLSSDQSYDKDSFIDDEENHKLLSGEEYDLSFEDNKRRNRIIQLSSGSDEEIVRIKKPERKIEKRRKKSRIIRYEDSSDEDIILSTTNVNSEENITEDVIASQKTDYITEVEDHIPQQICTNKDDEVVSNVDNVYTHIDLKSNEENDISDVKKDKANIAQVDDAVKLNVDNINEVENGDKLDAKEPNNVDKQEGNVLSYNKNSEETKSNNPTEDENISHINVASDSENLNKKIVILENIKVQDICNKNLSDHINNVINSLFSGINKSNEVSLNLSLDCSSETFDESMLEVEQHTCLKNRSDIDRSKSDLCITKQQIQHIKVDGKYKRSKKMGKEKNKQNLPLQITENNKTQTSFPQSDSKKKKKRKKKKKTINNINVSTELLLREENYESKFYPDLRNENKSKKEAQKQKTDDRSATDDRSQKRKRSTSETSVLSGDGEKLSVKKHRKRKKLKLQAHESENTKLSLLAEAILDNKKKAKGLSHVELSDERWEVEDITVKPSQTSQTPTNAVKIKPLQRTKNDNVMKKRFHGKDFRNLVLYDSTRVRRMKTQELMKRIL